MAIYDLPVRHDLPAYQFRQDFEGTVFTVSIRFNERMGQWIMDLADDQEVMILAGIPVLALVDLTSRFWQLPIPKGYFVCLDESGKGRNPDRDTFGKEVKFLYVESTEVA